MTQFPDNSDSSKPHKSNFNRLFAHNKHCSFACCALEHSRCASHHMRPTWTLTLWRLHKALAVPSVASWVISVITPRTASALPEHRSSPGHSKRCQRERRHSASFCQALRRTWKKVSCHSATFLPKRKGLVTFRLKREEEININRWRIEG